MGYRRFVSWTLLLLLAACSLPTSTPGADGTPAMASPLGTASSAAPGGGSGTSTPTDVPVATPELGGPDNPILLSLPPSQVLQGQTISDGQQFAALIEQESGLHVVAVGPSSYTELIEALRIGNAHIAALPPYVLVKAYDQGAVTAAFASTQNDVTAYGAQFVARSDQYQSYFDANAGRNVKDAAEALAQLSGKKPCWTTTDSLSGYRLPFGILNWYKIPVQDGAFTMSHFSVVRALELGSVCDFGATYIDARTYPVLKNEYPHITDDVLVVWQIPAIIPFDGLFLSTALPEDARTKLRAAIQQVALSGEGQRLLKSLYNMDGIEPVQDVFYAEFVRYITVSGADWDSLVH